jgi:hypothetical protein
MVITQEFLVAAFIGLVAVPLLNFVKGKLGWEGGKALLLSVVVAGIGGAAVYGVGVLLGLYAAPQITWDSFPGLFATVFAISQVVFQGLKVRREG